MIANNNNNNNSSLFLSKIATTSAVVVILFTTIINDVNAADNKILIEDFSSKKMNWYAKNDPVMGGQSSSTVMVEEGLGKFNGKVVDVPFLKAPGFITMESRGGPYPDVSCCEGIEFVARADTDYGGYRFSFGMGHADGGRYAFGFKTRFDIGPEFSAVQLGFKEFSDNWDDATGDIKVTCADESKFCPDTATLKDMGVMQFWGEGVNGVVDLQVKTVSAYGCTDQCGGFSARNDNNSAQNGDSGRTRYDDGTYNGNGGYRGGNNGNGGYRDGNNGRDGNRDGNNGRDGNRDGNNYMRPATTEGSAKEDIKNTIAVPMAIIAMLASFLSLFCICQMKSDARFQEPQPVLTVDTAVEMD